MLPSLRVRVALLCFSTLFSTALLADDDDTRLLLNKIDRGADARERANLGAPDPAENDDSLITIEGQTYSLQNTLEDLGPAIYVSINLQQWGKVRQFVERYRQLPGHEPALVEMAEGLIDRSERKYKQAIAHLRRADELQPGFVRARLELARTLFEDSQTREAEALFAEVAASDVPEQVLSVLGEYRKGIDMRRQWHGSVSLGFGHNSNINQGNGMTTVTQVCSVFFDCFDYTRQMPKPIGSSSVVYDAAAERRLQISGNHHVLVRGLTYGNNYDRYNDDEENDTKTWYDDNTSVLYAGYNYQSALNDVSLTPLFENYYADHHTKYEASGVRGEWKHNLTNRLQVSVQAQHKHFRFQGEQREYFDDYDERQAGMSLSYLLDPQTLVFGGVTYTRRSQDADTASNREYMGSLGAYHSFDIGVNLSLIGLYRTTRYDEPDVFLGGLRKDRQQIYIANLSVPRLAFAGVVPSLYAKRTVTDSSIDWAYSYRQTEVALKFEKTF
ncbi:porin family protein [Pseudomonas sp. 148P]|uniref:Porin family protein n=1 Tax=Pseudomonas ulcerans TaxID=3115852 RepID=A0ABU7HY84_9PSED|nr:MULTISPECIES: porin family protein [unclassified Pseudomonas]MEE1925137.1 porin family protein [Pseudomonas sp. 147P]MEE1936525.1 porin family protein [Pseudomonas sp. 148P]